MNLIEHRLKENDNLEKLSVFYSVPVCMIMRANRVFDVSGLHGRQTLLIPDRLYCMRMYEENDTVRMPMPFIEYEIQEGDTIFDIAQRYGTTMNIIARLNPMKNPTQLFPGKTLKILKSPPKSIRYSVRPSDTIKELSMRYHVPLKCIRAFNCLEDNENPSPGMQLIIPHL